MRRSVIWVVIVLALAGALVAARGGWNGRAGSPTVSLCETKRGGFARGVGQRVLSFTIDGSSSKGVKRWRLAGRSAEMKGGEIHLIDLEAVAYGEDAVVNLTCDAGIYRKDKGEVELIGNVEVVSDDGSILKTDRARWSQVTKEISTDAVVSITREGMSAVGKGGMANSEARTAMLKENVMVVMEPHTKVNCDGPLEVDYNGNVAVFYGNVRVVDSGGRLFADKLTAEFNPETRKLAQVTAEGNVRIKRDKSYTISDKAVYTDTTKSARLSGNPRVVIDPEEVEGLSTGS